MFKKQNRKLNVCFHSNCHKNIFVMTNLFTHQKGVRGDLQIIQNKIKLFKEYYLALDIVPIPSDGSQIFPKIFETGKIRPLPES